MPRYPRALCVVLIGTALGGSALGDDAASPLKDYVAAADDSFVWTKRQEGKLAGATFHELTLTSQTWKDTVWRHQLFVILPDDIDDSGQAVLLIDGGSWNDKLAEPLPDGKTDIPSQATMLAMLGTRLKSPIAVLKQVPQQPIFDGMVEDEAISYTFDQYLKTGDDAWPLLLPMVKSAVRAMDAVQQFVKQQRGVEIEHFTLTGASKRGWTTWLAASVDPRVNAFAPMVIDMLNMSAQMKHQLEAFGAFSEEIADYTERDLQAQSASEAGQNLEKIVDPFHYRQLLAQPKVILLGTNDRYWPLDALNLYWSELIGQKHVLYVPNNGHGLNDFARITGTIAALHRQAAGKATLPELTWRLADDGRSLCLRVSSNKQPAKVAAWVAVSPTRDFREARWTSHETELVEGEYCFDLGRPDDGYAAMFGEAMFSDGVLPYYLSTNVKIVGPEGEITPGQATPEAAAAN